MKTSTLFNWEYKSLKGHPFEKFLPLPISQHQLILDIDVKLLSAKSTLALWHEIFGCDDERRFFEKNHWLNNSSWESLGINWLPDYNEELGGRITQELVNKLSYINNDIVFYFNDPYEALEISWDKFSLFWMPFFEYNDESYIWKLGSDELLLVTPHGEIKRTKIPIGKQLLL